METASEPKVSFEQIVDEALKLLKDEGIARLSMRRLAARVGVKAPTLYYYLPDKAALMSAMMDRLFRLVLDAMPDTRDWQEWMMAFGRAIWTVQDTYPFTGELIAASMLDAANLRRLTDDLERMLSGMDKPVADLMGLQSSVQSLMTGWATFAHARSGDQIQAILDLEKQAFVSLAALVRGWQFSD